MEVLAKRLKWLREKERYGQKEVAGAISVSTSGYQKFEHGNNDPKLETLIKLADFFKVSTDFLLGRSNSNPINDELTRDVIRITHQIDNIRERVSTGQAFIQHKEEELKALKSMGSDSVLARKDLIERSREKYENLNNELHSLQREYEIKMIKYIEELIEIPFSQPHEDEIIKGIRPIKMQIQLGLFDTHTIALFGKKGFIGNYGEYQSIEQANEAGRELYELLNGEEYREDTVEVW